MSTSNTFGKVFCVGVGPGDPDLITVKGQRLLRDADIIAFPGDSSIAYQIALEAVPEIREKAQLSLHMPMTADPIQLDSAHRSAVISLETVLKDGSTVAVVTLGDPAFYSSFSYLLDSLLRDGFEVEIIPGVTSFSAASAQLLQPLSLGAESVHILTSIKEYDSSLNGTLVILKAGRHLTEWKSVLAGRQVWLVENCGMPGEKVYYDDLPATAGYFSLLIAK